MKSTILAVTALLGALTVTAQQQAPAIDTVIFRVNGEPIRIAEVNLAAQNLAAQLQQQGQQVQQEEIGRAAVQQVIDSKLLAQEARRRELEADAAAVDETLARFQTQSGGAESLATELESSGLGIDWLRGVIAESQLVQALIENEIRPTVEVTDEEVEQFFADNPDAFATPEQVRARHILFTADLKTSTDEERESARDQAEMARQRALGGEDFAELAEELSQGPSASRGGDLGFFTKDRMVEPFASAAFALQPGEISPVVGTEFGYHVIRLEERKPASTRSLDDAREEIRQALQAQGIDSAVGELLSSLREKGDIVSVGPAAEAAPTETAPASPGEIADPEDSQ